MVYSHLQLKNSSRISYNISYRKILLLKATLGLQCEGGVPACGEGP